MAPHRNLRQTSPKTTVKKETTTRQAVTKKTITKRTTTKQPIRTNPPPARIPPTLQRITFSDEMISALGPQLRKIYQDGPDHFQDMLDSVHDILHLFTPPVVPEHAITYTMASDTWQVHIRKVLRDPTLYAKFGIMLLMETDAFRDIVCFLYWLRPAEAAGNMNDIAPTAMDDALPIAGITKDHTATVSTLPERDKADRLGMAANRTALTGITISNSVELSSDIDDDEVASLCPTSPDLAIYTSSKFVPADFPTPLAAPAAKFHTPSRFAAVDPHTPPAVPFANNDPTDDLLTREVLADPTMQPYYEIFKRTMTLAMDEARGPEYRSFMVRHGGVIPLFIRLYKESHVFHTILQPRRFQVQELMIEAAASIPSQKPGWYLGVMADGTYQWVKLYAGQGKQVGDRPTQHGQRRYTKDKQNTLFYHYWNNDPNRFVKWIHLGTSGGWVLIQDLYLWLNICENFYAVAFSTLPDKYLARYTPPGVSYFINRGLNVALPLRQGAVGVHRGQFHLRLSSDAEVIQLANIQRQPVDGAFVKRTEAMFNTRGRDDLFRIGYQEGDPKIVIKCGSCHSESSVRVEDVPMFVKSTGEYVVRQLGCRGKCYEDVQKNGYQRANPNVPNMFPRHTHFLVDANIPWVRRSTVESSLKQRA